MRRSASLVVFIISAIGIVMLGMFYYKGYEHQYRASIESQLSSVSELKVGALDQYRKERLSDAAILYDTPAFVSLVKRLCDDPGDADAAGQVEDWLTKYKTHYQYDQVFLLDARGALIISTSDNALPLSAASVLHALDAMSSPEPVFQDFYRDEYDSKVYLAVLVPVREKVPGSESFGVVVLRIDPESYLYPFIAHWPVPSSSAETLLIRHDGDDVVFLNDLRFRADAALGLRFPLIETQIPAVKAALGETGIVEGLDYRNIPVIASIGAVPNSPWFIVARMDSAEAFAPLRERLWIMIASVVALLVIVAGSLLFFWRNQKLRFYKDSYKAEQALREVHWRLESIIESTHAGTWEWNVQTGQTIFNEAWAQIIGYTLAELAPIDIGTWNSLKHPDDLRVSKNYLARHFSGELPFYDVDCRMRHKDGTWVWVHDRGRVVSRTVDGEPLMMFGTNTDITERKVAEMKVQNANVELERRVAERTAQLENSNSELQAFTYSISHDLRAPLRAIDGFSRFLLEDHSAALDHEGKRLLGVIRSNTQRMDKLISDLLNLSRITQAELRYLKIDMTALVSSVLPETAPPDALTTFTIELTPLPPASGDPSLLRQVWVNLLSNAFKYSIHSPRRHIQIGGHIDAGYAVYYVRDEGAGFDPEYADKLFGVFQRLHTTEEFEGNGVGLAIVKRIIMRHGGRVWADGKPNVGATFEFSLPVKEPDV